MKVEWIEWIKFKVASYVNHFMQRQVSLIRYISHSHFCQTSQVGDCLFPAWCRFLCMGSHELSCVLNPKWSCRADCCIYSTNWGCSRQVRCLCRSARQVRERCAYKFIKGSRCWSKIVMSCVSTRISLSKVLLIVWRKGWRRLNVF